MSDYKYHISHRFGSCRHVANARDPHRDRDVKLYHIPGNFEVVGIDDGTDCFISPVTIDPFSAGIARIYADIRAGKTVTAGPLPSGRKRIITEEPPATTRKRVALIAEPIQPSAPARRRIAL